MTKSSKFLLLGFFLIWQNANSQLLYPKDYSDREEKYLPPYDPNVVIISPDVDKWMKEQLSQDGEKRAVEMKTDVMGRVKSSTDKTKPEVRFVENKQKRLVLVSDMHIPQIDMEPMHGYSEYNSKTKNYNYYLNGKKVDIKEYENLMEKHWKKFDSQNKGKRNLPVPGVISSDSRSWTAWMTAEEISALTKNYKELAIEDYIEPIPEAPVADILRKIELSTHAFPNGYTGDGVGVAVVEVNCRDTSIPLYRPNNYTSHCTGSVDTHHSMVVNVVQHAAPDARVFGFRSSKPHPHPDSSIFPFPYKLQIATYSYGSGTGNLYSGPDMNMDNYIYDRRIIAFKSAGNTAADITSPGKALNITTVGAVCPAAPCRGDQNNITDGYTSYSSRYNSEVGNEKPDAAMYTDINLGIYGDGNVFNGTSAAAPLLAGFMASLLDECSFCRRQPAMMKASIISAEKIPIVNASSWDRDNYKSAQGMMKFSTTTWWTGGAWWDGGNSAFFDSNNDIIFMENNVNAGGRHKITISWLSEGNYVSQNKRIQQDLDLSVYQNGQYLAGSSSWDNPFETVNFVAPTGDPLKVVIHRFRNSGGRVVLGYNINYNH